jgi:hypothetical protein
MSLLSVPAPEITGGGFVPHDMLTSLCVGVSAHAVAHYVCEAQTWDGCAPKPSVLAIAIIEGNKQKHDPTFVRVNVTVADIRHGATFATGLYRFLCEIKQGGFGLQHVPA